MQSAFIARQPIFDRKLDVVGYELLFRGGGYVGDGLSDNPQRATATVVLNSFTELELKRIVGHKTAWVNVGREFVVDGLAQVIPASLGGLEISEDELFDEELVDVLRDLKSQGYRLALDGFSHDSGAASVLELFDVVKLNVIELGHEGLTDAVQRLQGYPCKVLAHRVATHPDHEFCAELGCDLFQGYFFCQPAVVGTRSISANRLALLQVVAALQRSDVELSDVEQLIARDVALSFRMLRYVNSAFFGVRSEVRSIGHALALLGLDNARRWATLSVLASVDDKPTELTLTALTRARFCELAGAELGLAGGAELFTLGLFSVIDALMDTPMQDVVESLPLADDMRDALVHRRGPLGELLNAAAAREQGENGGEATVVPHADELYLRSVIWANTAAESLFGAAPSTASTPSTPSTPGTPGTPARAPRPEPAPATAAPFTVRPEGGAVRRFFAAIGRLFGRRD
jgi:EAL and modified HD-GYP domain-containing signal transduction protein